MPKLDPSPQDSKVDSEIALSQLLGERVLQLRTRRGMDQGTVAALAGVHASAISRLETGQMKRPPLELTLRLAIALGEPSIERLLGESLMSQVGRRLPGKPPTEPKLKAHSSPA
jgi:transcriptional regulator with XRE-family HTH domain